MYKFQMKNLNKEILMIIYCYLYLGREGSIVIFFLLSIHLVDKLNR